MKNNQLTQIKEKNKKCMSNLASCFCYQKKGHKGLHKCRCGGSWDNKGFPHSFPNISFGYNAFPSTNEELDYLNTIKTK